MHWDKHVLITIIELLFHWLSQNNIYSTLSRPFLRCFLCLYSVCIFSFAHDNCSNVLYV